MQDGEDKAGKTDPAEMALASLGSDPGESPLLRDRIVATLRRAIELGELRASDRLIEKDLCARLGVSRSPLREALRELEANGVVRKISARTLVITPLSDEDAINISRVRAAVEAMLAENFCRYATQEHVVALQEAMMAVEAADPINGSNLDATRTLYKRWCEGAGNMFAYEMLRNLQLRLSVFRGRSAPEPGIWRMHLASLRDIVANLVRRDAAGAAKAALSSNREMVMALLYLERSNQPPRPKRRRK